MPLSIKMLTSNSTFQKSSALLLGFLVWSHVTHLHHHTITVTLPLCFYGEQNSKVNIDAPATVTVTLSGKKSDLARIDPALLAVHINVEQLHNGNNGIMVSPQHLFLPTTINVINYKPLPCVIIKSERTKLYEQQPEQFSQSVERA